MKIKELRKKDNNELNKILAETRENWRELRFKVANGQLKNVRAIKVARSVIAQILTILKEREIIESLGKKDSKNKK